MQEVTIFGMTLSSWMFVPIIYFVWLTVFFILKKAFFNRIKAFAAKTKNRMDDIIVEALDLPLTLVIFISGAFLIEKMLPLDGDLEFAKYFGIALRVTSIVAVIMFLDTLFKNLIKVYSAKSDILKTSGGIAQGLVRGIVYGIGFLILIDSFGISITPILASLGVGSLAIALALQPTLENFFAGIQIVIDKPIMVGQFVKLDSGEEEVGLFFTDQTDDGEVLLIRPSPRRSLFMVRAIELPEADLAPHRLEHERDLFTRARQIPVTIERHGQGCPTFERTARWTWFDSPSSDVLVCLHTVSGRVPCPAAF